MYLFNLATLILASLSTSSVRAGPMPDTASAVSNGEQPLKPIQVMVQTKEGERIMDQSDYKDMLNKAGVSPRVPDAVHDDLIVYDGPKLAELVRAEAEAQAHDKHPRRLQSRGKWCDNNIALVIDKTETFVDWDRQMSPVVCAQGKMMVSVANGYIISNSVTASSSLSPQLIADKLSASLGIDFTKSWSSNTMITTTGNVQDSHCGVMITKPIKTRRTGRVFKGCVSTYKQSGTFQADSYNEINLNGIKWVEGAISMCMKPGVNPPLSRCSGEGNFI